MWSLYSIVNKYNQQHMFNCSLMYSSVSIVQMSQCKFFIVDRSAWDIPQIIQCLATTGLVKCGKCVVMWFSASANHMHSARAFRILLYAIPHFTGTRVECDFTTWCIRYPANSSHRLDLVQIPTDFSVTSWPYIFWHRVMTTLQV